MSNNTSHFTHALIRKFLKYLLDHYPKEGERSAVLETPQV